MILPDVNVLVYAFRREALRHEQYAAWLADVVAGEDELALHDTSLSGFVRIVSHQSPRGADAGADPAGPGVRHAPARRTPFTLGRFVGPFVDPAGTARPGRPRPRRQPGPRRPPRRPGPGPWLPSGDRRSWLRPLPRATGSIPPTEAVTEAVGAPRPHASWPWREGPLIVCAQLARFRLRPWPKS